MLEYVGMWKCVIQTVSERLRIVSKQEELCAIAGGITGEKKRKKQNWRTEKLRTLMEAKGQISGDNPGNYI